MAGKGRKTLLFSVSLLILLHHFPNCRNGSKNMLADIQTRLLHPSGQSGISRFFHVTSKQILLRDMNQFCFVKFLLSSHFAPPVPVIVYKL